MGSVNTEPLPVQVTAGAQWRPIPESIVYEATLPITYQMDWNLTLVQEHRIEDDYTCTTGSDEECEYQQAVIMIERETCKQIEMLETVVNKQLLTYNEYQPYDVSPFENFSRKERALEFIGEALSWCCGVATERKLNSLVVNDNDLRNKVRLLSEGLQATLHQVGTQSKAFEAYANDIENAFANLDARLTEFESHMTPVVNDLGHTLTAKYLYRGFRKTLRILYLVRNQEILNQCRNSHIPLILVSPQVLQEDLQQLNINIRGDGRKLAIPIEQIDRYYTLPIAECAFSNNQVVVRVKIPIIKIGHKWDLLELVTTPFAWHNDTCTLLHDTVYLAVEQSSEQVRTISGTSLHQCRPYHDKLCFVPRFSSDTINGHQCALFMYQGATTEALSQHCPLKCQPSVEMVITELSEDVYVVTHPRMGINIRCKNETKTLRDDSTSVGAIKVDIPCDCTLNDKDQEIIPERFPCGGTKVKKAKIIRILPATWSVLKSYRIKPTSPKSNPIFNNLSECLNNNWTFQVPHLKISTSESLSQIESFLKTTDYSSLITASSYSSHIDGILVFWNCLLMILIVYTIIRLELLNRRVVACLTPVVLAEGVRGQGITSTGSSETTAITCIVICCIGVVMIFGLEIFRYSRRIRALKIRVGHYKEGLLQPPSGFEMGDFDIPQIEEHRGGTLTLPNGRRFQVRVEDFTDESGPDHS